MVNIEENNAYSGYSCTLHSIHQRSMCAHLERMAPTSRCTTYKTRGSAQYRARVRSAVASASSNEGIVEAADIRAMGGDRFRPVVRSLIGSTQIDPPLAIWTIVGINRAVDNQVIDLARGRYNPGATPEGLRNQSKSSHRLPGSYTVKNVPTQIQSTRTEITNSVKFRLKKAENFSWSRPLKVSAHLKGDIN